MTLQIPPILPLLPNRVWRTYSGGRTLDIMENKENPVDSHFPEDWIISTTNAINKGREEFTEEGLSRTVIGSKEYFLRDLFAEYPEIMLGEEHVASLRTNAGFLLKYLDSSIRLHMQCHPTAGFSRQHLNANAGKTEGYIILGHREGVDPYIYMGFQRSPDQQKFKEAITSQDTDYILSHFDKISVKAGDVFLVPGGLPHAIGEGVFMIEIMEPTDFAVRIEFERGGYVLPEESRFMGRDADFALSMFDFSEYSFTDLQKKFFVTPELIDEQPGGKRWSLFDKRYTNCFRAERIAVSGEMTVAHSGFRSIIIESGCGTIESAGEEFEVSSGTRLLIPHNTKEFTVKAAETIQAIIALPPLR